tara:strand:+ start:1094 stop:1315 length:222 start_codon:yes stop_codon:yes gene_type:complete
MSYYIAPQDENIKLGTMVIYTVVKRLSDFKPSEGKLYRVFKSRREINESHFVWCYRGINGRLRKCKKEFVLRF